MKVHSMDTPVPGETGQTVIAASPGNGFRALLRDLEREYSTAQPQDARGSADAPLMPEPSQPLVRRGPVHEEAGAAPILPPFTDQSAAGPVKECGTTLQHHTVAAAAKQPPAEPTSCPILAAADTRQRVAETARFTNVEKPSPSAQQPPEASPGFAVAVRLHVYEASAGKGFTLLAPTLSPLSVERLALQIKNRLSLVGHPVHEAYINARRIGFKGK